MHAPQQLPGSEQCRPRCILQETANDSEILERNSIYSEERPSLLPCWFGGTTCISMGEKTAKDEPKVPCVPEDPGFARAWS